MFNKNSQWQVSNPGLLMAEATAPPFVPQSLPITNKEVFQKSLDQYENEVMKIFNCNLNWPICLYDFTYKNKIPQYLCFRTSNNPPVIIEDYFKWGLKGIIQAMPSVNHSTIDKSEGLLMERGHHMCCEHDNFVNNFKLLFQKGDNALFMNSNL